MSLIRHAFLSVLTVLWIAGGTCCASEESDRETRARALFDVGMAQFQAADYDRAIASWEEAFHTRPAPELLYNIGQAYRRSHRPAQAIPYYRRYLDLSPHANNRADIEQLIAMLERETRATATAAPAAGVTGSDAPAGGASVGDGNTTDAGARSRPLTRRAWFWGAVGGGVLAVAAAVTVAVVVTHRHDPAQSLPGVNFALRF